MIKGMIGVITNDQRRVFQKDLIAGIEACAAHHQFKVRVDSIAEDPEDSYLVERHIDDLSGVIVISNVLDNNQLHQLHQSGKPISLISHCSDTLPIPAIIQNNSEGIYLLVDYLVTICRRRNLVYIRGDVNQYDGQSRDRAFQECIYRHDLEIPRNHWLKGDFELDIAAESLDRFIRDGGQFDGIIAADYLMARAALGVLKSHGLRVPNDVCVVGFGDGPEAGEVGLTTVGGDIVELGKRSARQLLAQIRGIRVQGVTWLNTQIIERKTCSPVYE